MVFLQHQSDVVAHPLGIPVGKVHPVEPDLSALGLIELVEKVDDGALARAAQTYQGCNLAALDMHRDIEQRLGAIGIGEVDTRHLEIALHHVGMILA